MTQEALAGLVEEAVSSGGNGAGPARVPLGRLEDGQRVRGVYAVRERELRRKRNGEPWLRLTLGDASGSCEAVSWEDAEALYALAAPARRFT
jgi:hypothetical protein